MGFHMANGLYVLIISFIFFLPCLDAFLQSEQRSFDFFHRGASGRSDGQVNTMTWPSDMAFNATNWPTSRSCGCDRTRFISESVTTKKKHLSQTNHHHHNPHESQFSTLLALPSPMQRSAYGIEKWQKDGRSTGTGEFCEAPDLYYVKALNILRSLRRTARLST